MMSLRSPNAEEEKSKLKAAETLELDRVRLLLDQPFIGAVLIRLNLVPVVDFRCRPDFLRRHHQRLQFHGRHQRNYGRLLACGPRSVGVG